MPRPIYLRATARRKVAPGVPSRLPLRALPALDGLPVPPHARRRQPASRALAPHVPNDGQGLHSYTCVVVHPHSPVFPVFFFLKKRTNNRNVNYGFTSVRSYVLPWCARKRDGHGSPRRARRGGRGHGECDAPAASFLVLLAQAREPCSSAWATTSSPRDCVLSQGLLSFIWDFSHCVRFIWPFRHLRTIFIFTQLWFY